MRGLFVTGTDTGVGKTHVASALVMALRQQGRAVHACKPVATGAIWNGRGWVSEDTLRLARALNLQGDTELGRITRWALPEPAAPPVAAAAAGIRLSMDAIVQCVRDVLTDNALTIVEGVGGLLCPLTEKAMVADLIGALELPLIVVARQSLGTLNHTALTLEAARRRGFRIAALNVCETSPATSLAERTNIEELRRRADVERLIVIPHGSEGVDELLPYDWWELADSKRG